jgi:hypothetical protein
MVSLHDVVSVFTIKDDLDLFGVGDTFADLVTPERANDYEDFHKAP